MRGEEEEGGRTLAADDDDALLLSVGHEALIPPMGRWATLCSVAEICVRQGSACGPCMSPKHASRRPTAERRRRCDSHYTEKRREHRDDVG
mgnify:CR=1 FL=1